MNKATLPLIIIATGSGWLLSSYGVIPGVDWAWVLVIGVVGIISLANGINNFSVVFGPVMLIASTLMVLMQSKKITVELAIPILVISIGVLLLISRLSNIGDSSEENIE